MTSVHLTSLHFTSLACSYILNPLSKSVEFTGGKTLVSVQVCYVTDELKIIAS